MEENSTENLTRLFKDARAGKRESPDKFLPLVYDELKRIAAHKLAAERRNHTLQATAPVHEAYLRLTGIRSTGKTARKELAEFDETRAKIVELKFFGGLTNEEATEVSGVSDSTVKREWRVARLWLTTRLT